MKELEIYRWYLKLGIGWGYLERECIVMKEGKLG